MEVKVNNRLFAEVATEATDVSVGMLSVLLMLIWYCKEEGECWPRTRKLAKHCHITEGHCRYLLRELKKRGYVQELEAATSHTPPRYRVQVPRSGDAEKDAYPVGALS